MINKKSKTIILTAGGTGGHLFPAIAVSDALKSIDANIETHLITDKRCESYLPKNLSAQVHILNIYLKMSGFLNKLKSLLNLSFACFNALVLIYKIKPSVVIGFGGYPTFPILFVAKLFNIPIVLHEQNCFLGKSNRFFAKTAKILAFSYSELSNIDKYDTNKIIITGDIVRSSIEDLSINYNYQNEVFQIFIFGGSQGAKIFTTLVPTAIQELLKLNPAAKIKIVQQVSNEEKPNLSAEYKKIGIEHELSSFFHNMVEIYSNTQLVISRSGASTIAELTYLGIPAIFIPYPYAAENHQFFNAEAIENAKGGWFYEQHNLTPIILAKKLNDIMNNRKILLYASQNLLKRRTDGAARYLADTVFKIIS